MKATLRLSAYLVAVSLMAGCAGKTTKPQPQRVAQPAAAPETKTNIEKPTPRPVIQKVRHQPIADEPISLKTEKPIRIRISE